MSTSSDPSPFTADFERIHGLISTRSTDAWPALMEFVAVSTSGLETLWLLEEFIYRFAPAYSDDMAAQAGVDPQFAAAIAGVTPLDGGPELDAFLALQRTVRVRLGLDE